MVTRGFTGRRPTAAFARRLPPGQFETDDFPVLAKHGEVEVHRGTNTMPLAQVA